MLIMLACCFEFDFYENQRHDGQNCRFIAICGDQLISLAMKRLHVE